MNKVRRTSALTLIVLGGIGLVGGIILRVVVEWLGGVAPRPGWTAALVLLLAAVILASMAWSTWQSLHKKHQRMTSDYGITMLALGKSGALVGALVAGGYIGYAIAFSDSLDTPFGSERFWHSGAAGIAALLLMIAGLILEWACRLPGDDDEEGAENTESGPSPA